MSLSCLSAGILQCTEWLYCHHASNAPWPPSDSVLSDFQSRMVNKKGTAGETRRFTSQQTASDYQSKGTRQRDGGVSRPGSRQRWMKMPLPLVDQKFKAWPIVTFLSFLQDCRNRLLLESIGRTRRKVMLETSIGPRPLSIASAIKKPQKNPLLRMASHPSFRLSRTRNKKGVRKASFCRRLRYLKFQWLLSSPH